MRRLTPEELLAEGRPTDDLGGRASRGGALMFGSQGARFALQTLSTVVLARLLTPDDYGLFGMVAVVVGFAAIFKDMGLSTATVQASSVTRRQIDAMVWINLAVSVCIGAAVLLSAPIVATFYGQPELAPMTAALSLTFVVGGLTIQHEALLRRHFRFGELAVIQSAAQAASLAASVAAAILGLGYWALVVGALSSTVVGVGMTYFFCPLLPGIPRRGTGVADLVSFGRNMIGFEFINYWARNLDNILVGKFLGADPLGLYSRAYTLFMLPITQVRTPMSQVALPVLSALRSEPQRYRVFYSRLVEVMGLVTVPITMYCLVEAEFIVGVLLGRQWLGVVPTFRILAVLGLLQPTMSTAGLVMLSHGRSDRQLRVGVVGSLAVAIGFVIGLRYGIAGVATGYVVASYLTAVPVLLYSFAGTPIGLPLFARAVLPPLVAGSVAGGVCLLGRLVAGSSVMADVLLTALFFGVYAATSLSRPKTRELIVAFKESLRVAR